jgi:glycosyltransferase involved in cell wall biosynthesis
MSHPTISVVIPTKDRAEKLVDAVESAFNQTIEILEIIVVDDASETDPRPLLSSFGEKLRYEKLARNSGANVARNRGIELARGTLVAFLDDDDIWLPDKLALQVAAIQRGYEACLCNSQEIGKLPRAATDMPEVTAERLRISTPCGTSGLLATRDVLNVERFDPDIPRSQDWDLYVRLVQRGPLAFVSKPLYLRRTSSDGITMATMRQTPAELLATAIALDKHRAWLGEAAYRRRLARTILTFVSKRRRKLLFIYEALKHAGLKATVAEMARKFRRFRKPVRRFLGTDAV